MSKCTRTIALVVVATAAMAFLAAAAPARVTNVANTIGLGYAPYQEVSGGRFGGEIDSKVNYHCEQTRKVELFYNGAKVGSAETQKYPQFTISLASVPSGTYVAKIKKVKLPASLQTKPGKKHAIYCKAAQSKPVIVP